jgi:hypothetical protein
VLPEDNKRQYKRHSVPLGRINPYPGGGCTNIIFEIKPDIGNVSSFRFPLDKLRAGVLRITPGNILFFC